MILGLTPTGDLWLAEPGERPNKQERRGQGKHEENTEATCRCRRGEKKHTGYVTCAMVTFGKQM